MRIPVGLTEFAVEALHVRHKANQRLLSVFDQIARKLLLNQAQAEQRRVQTITDFVGAAFGRLL